MGLFGAAHRCRNLSHISYIDETWHSYTLPKEDKKNTKIRCHTPLFLLTSAFFQWKPAISVTLGNTGIDYILTHNF